MRSVIEYIKSDLYRYAGTTSYRVLFQHLRKNPSFQYSFWFRLCKSRYRILRAVAKFKHRRLSDRYGIQIPPTTEIGYGLYLGHHMCIVINQSAKIGNNCNLSPFTTIGANHGKAADIGNNVYIGPNVSIVENVSIHHNSTIGAGATVVKDVPENATVAGCPAKVISMKEPGRYIKNRWADNQPDVSTTQ
ncbi:MAG TPA: serine O-acetyltransferase [Nitrospiria bacterium]|nr:serine O-acetyltransferase [Nitrospiria bacterium]